MKSWQMLREEIIACQKCPRLVHFRETVPSKKCFENDPHWRRPIPGYGDIKAELLILGLAPSAKGGNRTGRIFTGDESGRFLMPALKSQGFANQSTSESLDDGLVLHNCYMTAIVKCVPPQNKPTAEENNQCRPYFWSEIHLLKNIKAVLALGSLAFHAYLHYTGKKGPLFKHGASYEIEGFPALYASYHPSPQNTNTGLLTEAMFCQVLKKIKRNLER